MACLHRRVHMEVHVDVVSQCTLSHLSGEGEREDG